MVYWYCTPDDEAMALKHVAYLVCDSNTNSEAAWRIKLEGYEIENIV